MTSFNALLIGLGLLFLGGVIMAVRANASRWLFAAVIVLSLISSSASAFVVTSRQAGTGTSVERGYPKPFHFKWTDGSTTTDGTINGLYFAANSFVHLGVWSLLAAPLPRRNGSSSTMPGGMLILRLVLGIVFLILGVVGSLLPVMQGWIFFLLAFLVLFPRTRMAQKILAKAEPKLPRVVAWLRRLE
jgi:hypothetical protein